MVRGKRRLRMLDELDEALPDRIRRERRGEERDDEERGHDREREDTERTPAEARESLPPRPAPRIHNILRSIALLARTGLRLAAASGSPARAGRGAERLRSPPAGCARAAP